MNRALSLYLDRLYLEYNVNQDYFRKIVKNRYNDLIVRYFLELSSRVDEFQANSLTPVFIPAAKLNQIFSDARFVSQSPFEK